MELCKLRPAAGSKKIKKRIGRGISSGQGKTSGKGHKGQKARAGGVRPGFEGGQMPLQRRVPKRGFTNIFRKEKAIVNLAAINNSFKDGDVIDAGALINAGLIRKAPYGIKILALGELSKKLTIKAHAFSKKALNEIEKNGGKAEVV